MKRIISAIMISIIICFSALTAYAEADIEEAAYMSRTGKLEATFTMQELIDAGELLIYQDNSTGYKASVAIEENTDYAYRIAFRFEDDDAFFGFKTDIDYNGTRAELIAVHSKAATLPHRKLTSTEYSSLPYGNFNFVNGFYSTSVDYMTEIREIFQKGIKGQGVNLVVYQGGLIRMSSTVLDTDTKGGYDARSFKEIIGIHSKKIILALLAASFGLKHMLMDNVSKNSAKLLERKKNGEK